MADFCRQCHDNLGFPLPPEEGYDLEGLITEEEVAYALCEGCGPTLIDHRGACLGVCDNPTHEV